ncbi:MAG: protein translocase subunit SecD [Gammaproteobacteria bacterium]|nr:protein translocase subunit SecD [Gammaproteobacteria bacterium]
MLNKYPFWKYLLIILVLLPGFLYALPNLFGDDPGVQIRGARGASLGAADLERVEAILADEEISAAAVTLDDSGIKIRLADGDAQLRAREALRRELAERRFSIALTLLPAAPQWLGTLYARPMYLGLDLRGGVHFLMEMDLDAALVDHMQNTAADLRTELRRARVRHKGIRHGQELNLRLRFDDEQRREAAREVLRENFPDLAVGESGGDGDYRLNLTLTDSRRDELGGQYLEQNMAALRNRIDELGVAEPIVQRQGERRIVLQLPGLQDPNRAKEVIGRTATLEMRLVDEDHDPARAAESGAVPAESKLYSFRNGAPILLKDNVIYSGRNMVDAAASLDSLSGGPIVSITLDAAGARKNQQVTGDNIGRRMAVVYIETRSEVQRDADGKIETDADGRPLRETIRDEEVITAPVIRDQLGKRFQIEGLDSVAEARDLALLLRAGALAAPVHIIEERTVGPSMGRQNITQGVRSVVLGFVLVLIFMVLYYRLFGMVANTALFVNLVLIVAVLSLLQATLTLPGVAGIVLTVGMAVDANVLIFERIREEIRNGNSPQASIHLGYDKAFSTIVDANLTTLIAAIVLFNFGTGPIKGFAITLSIGILTSMFTAIVGTRGVVNLVYGGRRVRRLAI